ncbi:class I SAM-dependent methyltransferase [Patescibacteria group bacterium]|nr:class I SAM-dependent methyltransferase [Patescibacteria group bacterium]
MQRNQKNTSWNKVAPWYNKIVGSDGHYYHEYVIIPGVLRLLDLKNTDTLVDLACGQGVLARRVPHLQKYLGLDLAKELIKDANERNTEKDYEFLTCDLSKILREREEKFDKAAIILALQNIEQTENVIKNAANYLKKGGQLLIVLNHPCFRIPRQSGWSIDEKNKQQQRFINRYLSQLKIPIDMNPGQKQEPNKNITWSFHHSLQDYSQMLFEAGFVIEKIEEWSSDKESIGKAAKMENRARAEIPLFMAISAIKT